MPSTRQHFDEEIAELRRKVLAMGTATEEMVRDAVTALVEQDMALAEGIIPRDDVIDRMDQEIEALCLRLMARQQPLAYDLRVIGTALKIITDVERIGDHAVDISKVARRMGQEMLYRPLVDIPHLADETRALLHEALKAFVHRDLERVEKVIRNDDIVDALYAQMRHDLQSRMQQDPASVMQASYLLFVAHYLERIADHCTNIAERVAFMETGQMRPPASRGDTGPPERQTSRDGA